MKLDDISLIWNQLLERLSQTVSESNMDMYIRQITPVNVKNEVITCSVPSLTLRSAIQRNYYTLIMSALTDITGNSRIS